MRVVDEKPETLHIYVVREAVPRPSLLPVVLAVIALCVLFILCLLSPYRQPERRVALRVPAVFPPLQTVTASIKVIPTGKKIYPATTAHGILTITNGSIIAATLPKDFLLQGNGIEIITDMPVFVPAGSANGFGFATVSAHAVVSGNAGNIPPYAINSVIGSSIYMRNLTAFAGGKDAHTVPVQLPQDRQTAVDQVRITLAKSVQNKARLAYPCKETVTGSNQLRVSWMCQFFTYTVSPIIHVTQIKLIGKSVIVDGYIVERPLFTGK